MASVSEEIKKPVKVYIVTKREPIVIPCPSSCTAENLCITICQYYINIPPLTRTLFALRAKSTDYFLKDNFPVLHGKREYELRIRFKVPRLENLVTLDENTFDYYFQQARNDLNDLKVSEITYPERKNELLGFGIWDMYRDILEKRLTIDEVMKDYKKYIPKVILKKHGPFPKKHAQLELPKLFAVKAVHANVIKHHYLQKLYQLAPNYLSEEFKDVQVKTGNDLTIASVHVAPFHSEQPGLRLYNSIKEEWTQVCKIEELVYLTRNGDNCLEVSRRGTPLFLKFKNELQLSSFISVCDGYYRLMAKWTFNLSKDDETPSLRELHRLKCHGPVGGAFSHRKLEEKRAKKHGCYILRQCQHDYNVFFLDVCTKNNTTELYKLVFMGHCYKLNNEDIEYSSIERLVSCHKNPDGRLYLNECIPPSEYDKSQLLLCGEPQKKGVRIDQAELQDILKDNKSPRCISTKDILLLTKSEKTGSGGVTATFKAFWKLDETKKLQVAFKSLQRERTNEYLKDFIDLASKWACVQSSSVVRLYGITLGSPTALVLEYIPLGPFDEYLKQHPTSIKPIHLKKVAANLARALWDLSESGIVHGFIRCKKLLLFTHDDDRIIVKLSGPTLHTYDSDDVHWIPVEYLNDMNMARETVAGDIWAFATTLWEMFSYGQSPKDCNPVLTAKSYEMGSRLLTPNKCPSEVWALVRQCWQADPHSRPRPQEIMRDMNHMLYREYMPLHAYEDMPLDLDPALNEETVTSSDRFTSDASSLDRTSGSITSMNGTMSDHLDNSFADNKSSRSLESIGILDNLMNRQNCEMWDMACGGRASRPDSPVDYASHFAPRLMESIVSHGKSYFVTRTKRIGSGNYGQVYKGWMEVDNQESQKRDVAIKTLSSQESFGTLFSDFKNELEIMKSLQHVNIVEILGYSCDPIDSDVLIVMEYLEEGSLSQYLQFQGDKLKNQHLLKFCFDIATGMDHISAKNVVHRDLAARNILVVNKHHVKISDFGLARKIPKEEDEYRIKTERLLPFNWYAPESAVEPWLFTTKSDVWSYGVTVWEIFTKGKVVVPKFDVTRPKERVSCFQIPDGCPSEVFRHLMKDCWELDPAKRPRFIELVHMCKRFLEEYK